MEADPTTLFHQEYHPMDYYAFQLDDIDFKSLSASPDQSYSSHMGFNSEISSTQNSFPVESPDQSVASAARPTKQLKTTYWNAYGTDNSTNHNNNNINPKASSSSSSKIISFENSNTTSSVTSHNSQKFYNNTGAKVVKPKSETTTGYGENLDFSAGFFHGENYDDKSFLNYDKRENKAATNTIRNQTQARDHVIAERKRREKLSQRFIALSAILPGLRKVPYTFEINLMHEI